MIRCDQNKFNRVLYILYPGDYFASCENCIIGTVTGSCVAVCLYDQIKGIGGMGHFIIPGSIGTEGIIKDDIASRGVTHMEYLLAEIIKLGGDRKNLKAKVFGAGYTLGSSGKPEYVSDGNIRFLNEYFTLENIPVERADLGGDFRRRIYFSIDNGVVYRQVLKNNEMMSEFVQLEKEYIDSEFRNRKKSGRVIIFD